MQIGFIGLGSMGSAMALNLVKAGHEVRAWNRSRIVQDRVPGITLVPVAADAFQADAVFTMLSDDPAIREVILDAGLLAKARPGLTHVITSTISVALARELEVLHEKVALGYVSAPVLGRPNVAASGQLNILAAGKADAVAAIEPLLASIGKRVWKLGEDPARANAAKIACNMMIAMAIEAMAEGVVLTESVGLDRADFFELIWAPFSRAVPTRATARRSRTDRSSPASKPSSRSRTCAWRSRPATRSDARSRCLRLSEKDSPTLSQRASARRTGRSWPT
jgi:3-hydroxyisobutyrate dehydrogenase-like beta-hydroxyacid dehydrogenase